MPGLIRRDDIDEVRARVNIADVVGDHVALKSGGVGSLKGLCPFHDERSPSFYVRPQVGRYHCFGCGEDGDVFTFLQKMDGATFTEAVERLAARIGFELHYEDGGQASDHGQRARLLAANAAAAEFFVEQLRTPQAAEARKFLGDRGFDRSAAERFGCGFAPKSYDALSSHLRSKGFTDQEIVTAGLCGKGERGLYDRFRGRLVWPIRDVTGATLGFGARKLFDDDQGPKYLNTPETPIYRKSQVLYGLDLARRDISRGKQVVVVEGYTDVMACHLAGVTTAVATCGTAFGVDHIKVVRRVLGDFSGAALSGAGEVVFTFDPDEAGQKAASRAFAEEQRFAAQTFVAVAPEGLDPCDLRLKRGDDAVRRLVATKKPMFEFMIRRELAQHDLETVEGRVAGLRAAAPVVAGIRDSALSVGYTRTLAGWLGLDPDEVGRAVRAASRGSGKQADAGARAAQTSSRPGRPPQRPDSTRRDGSARPDRGGRPQSGASRPAAHDAPPPPDEPYEPYEPEYNPYADAGQPAPAPRGPSIVDLPIDPITRLERDALMAMLQHPEQTGKERVARVASIRWDNRVLAVVGDAIAVSLDDFGTPAWVDRVAREVPEGFETLVRELSVAPLPEREGRALDAYCEGITARLIERDLLRLKADLLGQLQRLDRAADPDRFATLQRALVATDQERMRLRGE
ncbi:DNA primase [Herbiconiux sp. SYSU D00978]|uniref:DNA primase n=1 Tax=Herbiconiux sp. SYSU D00978 TaxID=2812562 RepID=UPI001A975EE3|nr:DNA primase [Herbiconiux sp. SYSU D00978]